MSELRWNAYLLCVQLCTKIMGARVLISEYSGAVSGTLHLRDGLQPWDHILDILRGSTTRCPTVRSYLCAKGMKYQSDCTIRAHLLVLPRISVVVP